MYTGTIVAFAAASMLLLLIPGPAVTFVIARSLQGGRATGLASVAGLHVGTGVHIAAAVLGLSATVVSSAVAFTTIRWVGAFYLVYLGLRSLRRGDAHETEPLASTLATKRASRGSADRRAAGEPGAEAEARAARPEGKSGKNLFRCREHG